MLFTRCHLALSHRISSCNVSVVSHSSDDILELHDTKGKIDYLEVALIKPCFSCLLSCVGVCGSPLPVVSKLLFTALKSSTVAIKGNFVCAR